MDVGTSVDVDVAVGTCVDVIVAVGISVEVDVAVGTSVDVDVAVDVSRVALDADTQAANGSCKTKIIFYWSSNACINN